MSHIPERRVDSLQVSVIDSPAFGTSADTLRMHETHFNGDSNAGENYFKTNHTQLPFCSLRFSKSGLSGYPIGSVTSAVLETNLLAQLVQIFCRLIAVPVTQTTVSKHLRNSVPVRATHSLPHLLLMQHWTQPPSHQLSLF